MMHLQKVATVLVAGLGCAIASGAAAFAMGGHGGGSHFAGHHMGGSHPFNRGGYRPNGGVPSANHGVGPAMARGYGYGYGNFNHPGPAIYHVGAGNRGVASGLGYGYGARYAQRGFGGRHDGGNRFHRGYGRGYGYGLAGVGIGYGVGTYGSYPDDYAGQGYGATGYGSNGYASGNYPQQYGYGTESVGYGVTYAPPAFIPVVGGNSIGYDAGYANHCYCH